MTSGYGLCLVKRNITDEFQLNCSSNGKLTLNFGFCNLREVMLICTQVEPSSGFHHLSLSYQGKAPASFLLKSEIFRRRKGLSALLRWTWPINHWLSCHAEILFRELELRQVALRHLIHFLKETRDQKLLLDLLR